MLSDLLIGLLIQEWALRSLANYAGLAPFVISGISLWKVSLPLALGNSESYTAWRDFLRNMVWRGLNVPAETTTDGALGLSAPRRNCGHRACASAAWRIE